MGLGTRLLRLLLLGALALAPFAGSTGVVAAPKAKVTAKAKSAKAKGAKGKGKGKGKTAKTAPAVKGKTTKVGNATVKAETAGAKSAKGKAAKVPPPATKAKSTVDAKAKGKAKAPAGAVYVPPGKGVAKGTTKTTAATGKDKAKGKAMAGKGNPKDKLKGSGKLQPQPVDELEAEDQGDQSITEDIGYVTGGIVGVVVGLIVFFMLRRHGRGATSRREDFQFESMAPEAAFATALSSFEKQRRPIGKGTGIGNAAASGHAVAPTGRPSKSLTGAPASTMDGTGHRRSAAPKESIFTKLSSMLLGAGKRAAQQAAQRAGGAVQSQIGEAVRGAAGAVVGDGVGSALGSVGMDGIGADLVSGAAARVGERGAAALQAKATQAARGAVSQGQPSQASQPAAVSGVPQNAEALARAQAVAQACSFERFAEIQVALSCWKEQNQDVPAEVKRHFGVSALEWSAISEHWSRRLAADQNLRQQFNQFVPIYRRKYMTAA
jgi:hypothetical protein